MWGNKWQCHNTAHALCILDNQGYRHLLRICNTYCLFFYCDNGLFERASLLHCTYIGCLVGCLVFLSFPIATFSNLFAKSKSTFSHVTANTGFVSTVHVSNMSVTPVTRLVLFIMCKKDVFYSI